MSKIIFEVIPSCLSGLANFHLLYQCGFGKQHFTNFAALSFAGTIRGNMDQGQVTGAVFIDFRKAFDSVNHLRVLKKLYALSIVDQE